MRLPDLFLLLASASTLAACSGAGGGSATDGPKPDGGMTPDGNDASASRSFAAKLSPRNDPVAGYLVYPTVREGRAEPKGNETLLSTHVIGDQVVSIPDALGAVLIFKVLPELDCEAPSSSCVSTRKAMSVPTLPHPLLDKLADKGEREVHLDGGPGGADFLIVRTGLAPSQRPASQLPTLFAQVREREAQVVVKSNQFDTVQVAGAELVRRCPIPRPGPGPADGGVPFDSGATPFIDECDPSGPLMVPELPGNPPRNLSIGLMDSATDGGKASVAWSGAEELI